MSIPDSNWIAALKKAGIQFFGTIAAVFWVLFFVWFYGNVREPFPEATIWFLIGGIATTTVAVLQVIYAVARDPNRHPKWVARGILSKRFDRLSEEQKAFLKSIRKMGQRRFSEDNWQSRWFEELIEQGYVEFISNSMYGRTYGITRDAWVMMNQRKDIS